jgi:glycosyltransferase involved in cell wall biosynthesis
MFYDLIIVSQSTKELIPMTQRCIDSAIADTKDINVILVETGQPYQYSGVNKFIEYNGPFNYNRALNLGLKYAIGDIRILANNDLIFHPGWSKIGELMQLNGYHSASVISGNKTESIIYEGYQIGTVLNGWCIFMDKFCHETIGKLDETCSFWYSDDLYACQLMSAGIKHALFCNIRIDHIVSQTFVRQISRVQRQYQNGERGKFLIRQKYYAQNERMYKTDPENIQAQR